MSSKAARYIVGIDLGTTHTVVAYADTEADVVGKLAIHTFAIEQLVAPGEVAAREMLPSARYHAAGGELASADSALPWPIDEDDSVPSAVVGTLALELGAKVPGRLVTSAKSWLSHAAVDRTADILPWGAPAEVPKVSPVAASASYLRHVINAWDQQFPQNPLTRQDIVLTVPASFDEAARALTLRAARDAGLERPRLVEEPQAAFYEWLDRHEGELESAVSGARLALVCDVGGGTTDLTLIRIELRESGPRLTRIAVGDHLMLGGDNMDLALARRAEGEMGKGSQLGSARFTQLVQQCRRAKEQLLSADPPDHMRITVLGSGSRLVGGARSSDVTREDVHALVLDGFFPACTPEDRPAKRRGAIVEFGLPFVADAAITRHVAAFLAQNDALAREALGDRAPASGALVVPDAVLFNGGVFRGQALVDRMLSVLGGWRGAPLAVFANPSPELAVARGAVAYGLARRGLGLKIGGGSARSYFLTLDTPGEGVCLLPRGAEEGEDVELGRTFSLRLGRPVRFHLVASSSDVRHHSPGAVIEIGGDSYHALPPITAVLEGAAGDREEDVPVRLITALTEVGTLEMSCVSEADRTRRWKLEFQLRSTGGDGEASEAQHVRQLHPRFAQATELVRMFYGKSATEVGKQSVKTLRADLEKLLGPRKEWDTPLLRELFGALFAGAKRRRRTTDHERVWFNLVGHSMRPGFGYPVDDWRVRQLWSLFEEGVQFAPDTQNWAEWWIMWRRVSGGLTPEAQSRLINTLEYYLQPPSPRPRKRPVGPKMLGHDDMVRLAGSLEHVSAERKGEVGAWLVERLLRHDENPQTWWAVGRVGARVPFYGSAHNVVARPVAERWLVSCLGQDWRAVEPAPFAATLLARASGDRERDMPEGLRQQVEQRLAAVSAPASWQQMVREVTHLEEADERRIFGETLPPGLRLLD